MKSLITLLFFIAVFIQNESLIAQSNFVPFAVDSALFDFSQPNDLGLAKAGNTQTFTIFKPQANTDKYSNGVILIEFKGHFYAQWQSSSRDEDAADTWVAYSRSSNGSDWENPKQLVSKWNQGICTSGGWYTDGDVLIAYINYWPDGLNPKGGYVQCMMSQDGLSWTDPKPVLNNQKQPVSGIFEQDPRALPDGRIINAVHEQPGLIVTPYFSEDPQGITGWTRGTMKNLPYAGSVSREIEPSWFYQSNENIVMIFRDQASSFRKLASISSDRGVTWTTPVLTHMPDSRSKQCAGNLPDGTAFMIHNPVNNKNRFPLVIVLSKQGKVFDTACLLRDGDEDLQPLRYEGRYKRKGYHYPKAIVGEHYLYVSYATNKEDVEFTRVPIESLVF